MNRRHRPHSRPVAPRSTPPTHYPDFMAFRDGPVPLSWADAPDFLGMLVRAAITVVLGILLAPYLMAALEALQ